MEMHSQLVAKQLLDSLQATAIKKEKLLAANKEAARALLASISTVSYVTEKKNESTE